MPPHSTTLQSKTLSNCFFFSSRRRHTRLQGDWSSDVWSSDLALQPRAVHRYPHRSDHGRSRSETHLDQLHRTREPHDADVHASVHSPDEWLLQENREPHGGACGLLHVLQFRAHPSDAPRHPGDGCWRHVKTLERIRHRKFDRDFRVQGGQNFKLTHYPVLIDQMTISGSYRETQLPQSPNFFLASASQIRPNTSS